MATPSELVLETVLTELENAHQAIIELRREVDTLKARQAIIDTLSKYTRAVDRHDAEMLCTEVYHPDGLAEHADIVGTAPQIAAHLDARQRRVYTTHLHVLGNHICDLQDDVAHVETYFVTYGVMKDTKTVQSTIGRYIDRLERRDGAWKIALRRIISEARTTVDRVAEVALEGQWDRSDPAYQRPLRLPPEKAALVKARSSRIG